MSQLDNSQFTIPFESPIESITITGNVLTVILIKKGLRFETKPVSNIPFDMSVLTP